MGGGVLWTIQDDVVTFAVTVGAGDAEAAAGGGQGEGQFGDFSAAFGGLFALEWSLRAGSLVRDGASGQGLGWTLIASGGTALVSGQKQPSVLSSQLAGRANG